MSKKGDNTPKKSCKNVSKKHHLLCQAFFLTFSGGKKLLMIDMTKNHKNSVVKMIFERIINEKMYTFS